MKAIAYIDGPNTTDADAVAFRALINSQRIYIADPKVLAYDKVAAANVSRQYAPYLVGVRTRVDRDFGFWWSVSNKPIFGIVGVARPISYGAQANYLNERAVNTIINVNGEGLRTWGNRVATGDDLWKFEAVRRTADVINRALADAYLEFVDKPFSKANLKFMIESGNTFLRSLKNEGAILGGRAFLRADDNPAANLASGSPTISVEFEPPAPMEDAGGFDVLQWTGPKSDGLSIKGVLFPVALGGAAGLEGIRKAAIAGKPLMLVSLGGKIFGNYVVEGVKEDRSYHDRIGTPRQNGYEISLKAYPGTVGGGFSITLGGILNLGF